MWYSFVMPVLKFEVLTLQFSFDKCNETKELCVGKGKRVQHEEDRPSCVVLFRSLCGNKANKLHPRTVIIFVYLHG